MLLKLVFATDVDFQTLAEAEANSELKYICVVSLAHEACRVTKNLTLDSVVVVVDVLYIKLMESTIMQLESYIQGMAVGAKREYINVSY